ncbi:MAG: type II toxin-antitoxin system VapC family toxin [Nitrospinae bacterium]|nr:type II toxin-antitoxin system VapC family toxin [Nitrospinota bacterium]
MSRFVLDASVAVKWLIPEAHSGAAIRLLKEKHTFYAPGLIYGEVGNVLWKRARRGDITFPYAQKALALFMGLALEVQPAAPLTPVALKFALAAACSVYDAFYLILAMERSAPLVTADKKLIESVTAAGAGEYILWLGGAVP